MTEREQAQAFADDRDRLIDRYAEKFDISYTSIIGVLTMKVHELVNQSIGDVDNLD